MLAPILALAQCWNWDQFFTPWNWDTDVPILALCHHGAPSAGMGPPILELSGFFAYSKILAQPYLLRADIGTYTS